MEPIVEGFPFNRNWRRRNEILGNCFRSGPLFDCFDTKNGYGHFHNLSAAQAETLVEERFLDPEETQNASPPARTFVDFMKRFPSVTCHGYVIGPDREDYRVSVEGIASDGPISDEMRREVRRLFGAADEFVLETDRLFVWYD
jgi:hypothetical protein